MSDAPSLRPLEDFRALALSMPDADPNAVAAARARQQVLTKPPGSLGRLEEIAVWLAGWQKKAVPTAARPMAAIYAASHGVAARGVSAFPTSVTGQMLENFSKGGAAINQLCTAFDIGLKVFDLGIDVPTPDITEADAMSERECAATMAFGIETLVDAPDVLIIGEMGIANTTVASSVCHALYGGVPTDWVGRGTGVDDAGLARKAEAVGAAVARIKADEGAEFSDPLGVLRRVGGREIAAMAGAIIAARHTGVPVILDGFVVTAAAAVVHALNPRGLDHCIAGHCSMEAAHRGLLARLGKTPLLDLDMRLGEGSGAALAFALVRGAVACHVGMATFDEAGVSGG